MFKKLYKRLFSKRLYSVGYYNLFWNYQISVLGNYQGINENGMRTVPVIVSLTSYPERFRELPHTLYSLLHQKLKPDKLILWLDEELCSFATLPYEITQFVKNGLEIRFVKDLRAYTKFIYSFKEFPDSIVVTADDDVFYPSNWLECLYLSYIAHPEDIHAHKVLKIKYDNDKILPFKVWEKAGKTIENASFDNFICGVGGVLYPPKCFSKEIFRDDIFIKCSPNSDEIWIWVMAIIHNRKIRVVKNHIENFLVTNFFKQIFSKTHYYHNRNGGYDKQLNNLMKFYGKNILSKLNN